LLDRTIPGRCRARVLCQDSRSLPCVESPVHSSHSNRTRTVARCPRLPPPLLPQLIQARPRELVVQPPRHLEHPGERRDRHRVEVEGDDVGLLDVRHAREPGVLRDRRKLRHVDQRLERAADQAARTTSSYVAKCDAPDQRGARQCAPAGVRGEAPSKD